MDQENDITSLGDICRRFEIVMARIRTAHTENRSTPLKPNNNNNNINRGRGFNPPRSPHTPVPTPPLALTTGINQSRRQDPKLSG